MKTSGDFVDGPLTVLVDPAKPTDSYVNAQHYGTWKSTDCGFILRQGEHGQER